jgi:hypothetical protein
MQLHIVCIYHMSHSLQAKHYNMTGNTLQIQSTVAILKHGSAEHNHFL